MKSLSLKSLSIGELFAVYANILSELRARGVVRSTNNPIADYAEYLCARALSLSTAPKSTMGFDAIGPNNEKCEIKARRVTPQNPSRELSALRGLKDRKFDFLVGVLFDEDFKVARACLIPHAVVLNTAKYSQYTNAWRFHLRDSLLSLEGVVDLTSKLRDAEAASRGSY